MLNATKPTNESQFSHDCDCCAFLGQVSGADIWVCPAHNELICRFSSRPDHYQARGLSDFESLPSGAEWTAAIELLRKRQAQLAGLRL